MFKLPFESIYEQYEPAIAIERFAYGQVSIVLRVLTLVVLVGSLCYVLLNFFYGVLVGDLPFTFVEFINNTPQMLGVTLLAGAAYMIVRASVFYFNTFYFRGLDSQIDSTATTEGTVYEVARIVHKTPHDLVRGFSTSPFGKRALFRMGLDDAAVAAFLMGERTLTSIDDISFPEGEQVTLKLLAHMLRAHDTAFAQFLEHQGVTTETFEGAVLWTYREHLRRKCGERWWSKDVLSVTNGIGRDFAFGYATTLRRFTKPLASGAVYADLAGSTALTRQYVTQLETVLARNKGANVLLVGEPGVGKMDILITIGSRMEAGVSLGAISSKHLILLDTDRLTAVASNKSEFEQTFLRMLNGAERAGNVVLVIDGLPEFITSVAEHGVNLPGLMDEYLNSSQLQVMATAIPDSYHKMETNGEFLRRFERVVIDAPMETAVVDLLETIVSRYENELGMQFTYPAVVGLVSSAERYIVTGVMPDKAVQLIDEVVAAARARGTRTITVELVETYVSEKTGVPVGPIREEERSILMDLESILHQRIIGQENAIDAISGVMRRSRAGIHDADKPIGTFLFLGPTGVGKTESAKALAVTFFETEDAMHRIDMSEFSGQNALERLIGSERVPGVLSGMLREHPYAVVLLDEFEKASEEVHNLFLQILDEGVFADGHGKKVNARNAIIIATSNAGSAQIMEWVQTGADLSDKQEEMIKLVVSEDIYKPELINRFDAVVLFAPLDRAQQARVAEKMLQELKQRLAEKGYKLVITGALVEALVEIGYDPAFGARPMRRAIQDVVEEAIAEKIIAGTLKKGGEIIFTETELNEIVTKKET